MQYRDLGSTGLKVPLLGLGTGGPSALGQSSNKTQAEQYTLVWRCLDLGVNLFDTAPIYRRSEEILGHALRGVPRDSYAVVTKWVHHIDGDVSKVTEDPESLVRSVDSSLRHLGTGHIDVMMFHGVMPEVYDLVVERLYPVMLRLREAGKLRFVGLSTRIRDDPKQAAALQALTAHPHLWDVIMVKYGILNQYAAKRVLPLAVEHGVGVPEHGGGPRQAAKPPPPRRAGSGLEAARLRPEKRTSGQEPPRLAGPLRHRLDLERWVQVRGRPSRRLVGAQWHIQYRAPGEQRRRTGEAVSTSARHAQAEGAFRRDRRVRVAGPS